MNSYLDAVEARALLSQGTSGEAIYRLVAEIVRERPAYGGLLLDVGCGRGLLHTYVAPFVERYAGADAVRYDCFPVDAEFHQIDLDSGRVPLADGAADIVVAVETIEHLENPRAFARELTRLCKVGGLIVVTTPNQLSLLSKLSLVLKNQFPAFSEANYPAHLTALLEVDLLRIASECGWHDVAICYSHQGRLPGTSRHWPAVVSRLIPRALSDNLAVVGRKM